MDIDFVVLWVDGSDPEWLAQKNQYSPRKVDNSNSVNRFRDWNLMKYWFRSVEQFTPWFRKLFFVTWGHLPDFLNLENPRLQVVRHEEYMPEYALPTFSSRALEMNLFRIDGLSEHFVYFNDDMFIIRPLGKKRFFDEKSGLPVATFSELPCWFSGHLNAWEIAFARNIGIINRWFPKGEVSLGKYPGRNISRKYPFSDNVRNLMLKLLFPGYYTGLRTYHSPTPFLKETFEEIWEKEPALLRQTTEHKFRSTDDINQILAFWWQLAGGKFRPGQVDSQVVDISGKTVGPVCDILLNQTCDMLCINDPDGSVDFDFLSKVLDQTFSKLLPEKSSFEI